MSVIKIRCQHVCYQNQMLACLLSKSDVSMSVIKIRSCQHVCYQNQMLACLLSKSDVSMSVIKIRCQHVCFCDTLTSNNIPYVVEFDSDQSQVLLKPYLRSSHEMCKVNNSYISLQNKCTCKTMCSFQENKYENSSEFT